MQEQGTCNNDCGCYFDIEYSYRENALILDTPFRDKDMPRNSQRVTCCGQSCPFTCSANAGCYLSEKPNFLSNDFERIIESLQVIVVVVEAWETILKVKSFSLE